MGHNSRSIEVSHGLCRRLYGNGGTSIPVPKEDSDEDMRSARCSGRPWTCVQACVQDRRAIVMKEPAVRATATRAGLPLGPSHTGRAERPSLPLRSHLSAPTRVYASVISCAHRHLAADLLCSSVFFVNEGEKRMGAPRPWGAWTAQLPACGASPGGRGRCAERPGFRTDVHISKSTSLPKTLEAWPCFRCVLFLPNVPSVALQQLDCVQKQAASLLVQPCRADIRRVVERVEEPRVGDE